MFVTAGSGGLAGPRDLAFGPDGNLYVSSNDNDEVLVYNGTTGAFMQIFAKASGLAPRGIAFQRGELFLASEIRNQVLHYSLSGALIGVFASDRAISSPREIIFGPDGNLYMSMVASGPSTNAVLQFNGTTGALIRVFANTALNFPRGLAFGPDGNLYVANADGNSVVRFSGATGGFIDFFPKGGVLNFPTGVIFTQRVAPSASPSSQHYFGGKRGKLRKRHFARRPGDDFREKPELRARRGTRSHRAAAAGSAGNIRNHWWSTSPTDRYC